MNYNNKRWIALIAGVLIEVCSGIAYAWSVFQGPLMAKFNVSLPMATLMYTGNFWFSAAGFLVIGPIARQKLTIRQSVFWGSLIYVCSILATAMVQKSFFLAFLFFSFFRSLGLTLVYPMLLSYSVELFPERSGFASGVMAAGFGLGAMIWAPLATNIFLSTGDISKVFLYLGIIFGVVMLPLTFLLVDPIQDASMQAVASVAKKTSRTRHFKLMEVNRREMIRTPIFYAVFIGLSFALSSGNLVVNQASPIVQELFGVSVSAAAIVVSVSSIFNVIGRIISGAVSDRLGKSNVAFMLLCLSTVLTMLMLVLRQELLFKLSMWMVVFCYGGLSTLVSPITKEIFGAKHFTANYSVIYITHAIGSFLGPMVGTMLLRSSGSYSVEFGYALLLSVLGCAALYLVARKVNDHNKKQTIQP